MDWHFGCPATQSSRPATKSDESDLGEQRDKWVGSGHLEHDWSTRG